MAKCPACGNPITKSREGQRGCRRHGPIISMAAMVAQRQGPTALSLVKEPAR